MIALVTGSIGAGVGVAVAGPGGGPPSRHDQAIEIGDVWGPDVTGRDAYVVTVANEAALDAAVAAAGRAPTARWESALLGFRVE
jgi:hypothetical protein